MTAIEQFNSDPSVNLYIISAYKTELSKYVNEARNEKLLHKIKFLGKIEADYPKYAFDAPSQMDYMHPLIAKAGYDMVVAKWGKTYRAETIKSLPYDIKLTNLYRRYGKADPNTSDRQSDVAKTIINKLSSIANTGVGVSSGVTDRFYAAKGNIKKIISDPVLAKYIGTKLLKQYEE